MASSLPVRVLLVSVSTAVALGLAFFWLRSRPPPQSIRMVDNLPAVDRILRERERTRIGPPIPAGTWVREPIDEETARTLWPIQDGLHDYDPHCYFRYTGGLQFETEWEWHPLGKFETRTSSDGYREDFERLRARRDLLLLVTGDSHTDGLCFNRESFANLLEAALSVRRPGQEIEALNAGVSGYSLYHYLGVLERDLELRPDAFVVAFYGGNDFIDVVKPWHYFHRTAPPMRTREYWERLSAALSDNPVLVGNAFNQLLYFLTFPDQIEASIAACAETTGEIEQVCAERDIRLFYVFIPVGFPTSGELPRDVAEAKRKLALSEEDLRQYDRLADRWLTLLRARGQDPIDLREHFEDPVGEYYWIDGHIDLEGQALIAELLRPRIEAAFPIER